MRKARDNLAALGLTAEKIALSARRLERARGALEAATDSLAREASLDLHHGAYASFAASTFAAAPEEMRLRMLARLIAAFGGQEEPARLAKLEVAVWRVWERQLSKARRSPAQPWHGTPRTSASSARQGAMGWPSSHSRRASFAVWDRRFRVALAPDAGSPVTGARARRRWLCQAAATSSRTYICRLRALPPHSRRSGKETLFSRCRRFSAFRACPRHSPRHGDAKAGSARPSFLGLRRSRFVSGL